jgi:NAD(P)-dependent dehydrogenase (short-subunit alcohol dehydrogenase family)
MRLDYSNKTALVTGGSRGIGRRIASDLLSCGAEVIVTSTRAEDGDSMVQELGGNVRHMQVDFADPDSTRGFLQQLRALPALHVCVNNAGTTRHGPAADATENDWDVTNDVNLKAPYFVSQAAADVMKRGKYGRIVNIASIWAHVTMSGRSVYAATKFGLRGVTITHAVEWGRYNVLVNVVSPGFTLTDMVRKNYTEEHLRELEGRIPVGRLADVQDISNAVLFLASDRNAYITGQSLVVDGGYSVA